VKNNLDHQANSNPDWFSIIQFMFSSIAIIGLWLLSFFLIIIGFTNFFVDSLIRTDPLPMFMIASSLIVTGILIIPSAYFSFHNIPNKQPKNHNSIISLGKKSLIGFLWIIISFPIIIVLGYLISQNTNIAWLLLPPLHIAAIVIPVIGVLFLTIRNLPLGSHQRIWGVFSTGLILGPLIILILESLAALIILILGFLLITPNPEMVDKIIKLSEWLSNSNPSPELVFNELGPYLTKPVPVFIALFFGAFLVPLIEEAIKPIGVWLLYGKKLSPSAGFVAGALSGAGYAIFESLILTSNSQEWTLLVLARISTGAIHILTTSLVGWAIVQVWSDRRITQLIITYSSAVLIHGLWNALSLTSSFALLTTELGISSNTPLINRIGIGAPFALIFLAFGSLLTIMQINKKLTISNPKINTF
jgi:hypothetical protein